jgi:acetyl esterase/lipase
MSSRSLVDPELLAMLDMRLPAELNARTVVMIREAYLEFLLASLPPLPDDVVIEDVHIPGPPGRSAPLRLKTYRKRGGGKARPALVHLHGGGFVIGAPDTMAPLCAEWARRLDIVVVAPAYRLAPETSFPGNIDDAYAALAWAFQSAAALGIDTARIGVAGESAGGGLAACLALLARDRGEYRLCYQHLIFPMLDDRTAVRADLSPYFGEFMWTQAANHFGWRALLGQEPGAPDVSPYAAAARAASLAGLPPTFIATGALDLFTEENLDYARRLMAAGVPAELHVYPGAPHGFMQMTSARVTRNYARDAFAALGLGLRAEQA